MRHYSTFDAETLYNALDDTDLSADDSFCKLTKMEGLGVFVVQGRVRGSRSCICIVVVLWVM